jgi:hypothetical protein
VRTDANGDSVWTRTYGGTGYDIAISITATFDGYYVFAGMTDSWGAGSYDVYVQKVAPNGSPLLMRTYGGADSDRGHCIQATPDDGLVIAGRTYNNVTTNQGYAMRTLGYSPRIWTASDVPGDQGGQIRLCWFRSAYDVFESTVPIYEYSVWRRVDPLPPVSGAVDGQPVVLGGTSFPPGTWVNVTDVPALGVNEYCCVVPTVCDWTEDGVCWSAFCVVADPHSPGSYFVSPVDSGYSVDNLEPSPPAGLHMPTATDLAWDAAPEDDFDHYAVYGSYSGDFEDAEFITETDIPAMDVSDATYDYYHVTAVDHAGNESDDSSVENNFAAVPDERLPVAFALRRNHPNPFTSGTAIGFDMPRQGRVALEVIDVSGRVVRALVDEVRPAGRHSAAWNGLDAAGAQVGPGVYFVRMTAGDFSQTRKMMVLR